MTTQAVGRADRIADMLGGDRAAEGVLAAAERGGITALLPGDEHWPTVLDDLGADAPAMLWAKGDTSLLTRPLNQRITITGARAETDYGRNVTRELATDLARAGHILLSGGAFGIDTSVHRATLASGTPGIAVLASGLDRLYPAGNADLLRDLSATGLHLSEVPPGTLPTRTRFLQRCRILAALSGATLITEAGAHSGALSVAYRALALRRVVAAVPGPVTSGASAGCHRLIQDGETHLVTHASELTTLIT